MNYKTSPIDWDTIKSIIEKMMANDDRESVLLFGVAVLTGYRASDWSRLTWGHFVSTDGSVVKSIEISQKKTGKTRRVPISPTLKRIIEYCYRGHRLNVALFRGQRGPKAATLSTNGVNRRLYQICAKYGIDKLTSHALRKTISRHVYNELGANHEALMYVSMMLGHSSINTTITYLGIREETLDKLFAEL